MNIKNQFKELIFTLASIPSPSGQEEAILEFISNCLKNYGIPFRKQSVPDRFYNIIANENPNHLLLITSHVDTVAPWLGIFPPRIQENTLEGLGVCDDKAGIALMLLLLETRKQTKKPIPATFAFVVDEEREGNGSAVLATEKLPPYAVVLEPTNLEIAIAESGSVEIEIHVKGKAAHGSCLSDGINAIEKAIDLVSRLKTLSFLHEEDPLIGPGGLNVERFSGGDGELRVPDSCVLEIDFHVLPRQNVQKIISEIKEILEADKTISYIIKDVSEPFILPSNSAIISHMCQAFEKALQRKPKLSGMPSWTDAAHLYAAGIEPVVFGPGNLTYCHTPEEKIELSEVVEAFFVLDALLDLFSDE